MLDAPSSIGWDILTEDDGIQTKPADVNETAVKSILSSFTIFKFKGCSSTGLAFNMSLFPFVGILIASVTFVIGLVLVLISKNIMDLTPFGAVVILATPLVIFGFRTTNGLMKVSDRFSPEKTEGIGAAGLMVPVLFMLITYGIYLFSGVDAMFMFVPALEIAVTLCVLTAVYFSSKSRDERFTRGSDSSKMITALIISVISAVAFSGLAMIIEDALDLQTMAIIVCMLVAAIGIGVLMAKISDRRFDGLDEYVFFSIFDVSRPILAIIFMLLLTLVE